MDPITATTTLITLASFITDLIEVGQSIQRSIEKVGENRRRIRELTNDVLRTLADLASLTRGQEDAFQAPALLTALGNLKAEMLHVLSICREITPVQRPGFRRVGSQIKVWMKRDDLEKKIGRLKEHVNKCYLQFTTFSTARIEQTTARIEETSVQAVNSTLRVEQTLIVNNVESRAKLRHLEGMMAHLLLETQFGQNVLNQTMKIIESDSAHKSLESQYLSAQTRSLMDSFQNLLTDGNLVLHEPFWNPDEPFQLVFLKSTPLNTLQQILGAVAKVNESPTVMISLESMEDIVVNLGVHLNNIGMISEGIAWERLKIRILHSLAAGNHCAENWPQIASALDNVSSGYQQLLQFQAALQASQQSLDLWHHITKSLPEVDNRPNLVSSLVKHAENLLQSGQKMATLSITQDAVALSRPMATELIESGTGSCPLTKEDEYRAVYFCAAIFLFAKALSSANRHLESYETSMEGFQTLLRFRFLSKCRHGTDIDSFLDQICKVAEGGGLSLCMLADCVILFRDLARMYPEETSSQFLRLLYGYAFFAQQNPLPDAVLSPENLRIFLEPSSDSPPPALDFTIRIDFSLLGIAIEDAVRAYYTRPSHTFDLLMRSIFITHFEQAVKVLRETVEGASPESDTMTWALYSIADIVPLVFKSERMDLLQVLTKIIPHLGAILTHWRFDPGWIYDFILTPIFIHLWTAGLLNNALAESDEVMEYFENPRFNTDAGVVQRSWQLHLSQSFVLCDMGTISDATVTIQQTDTILRDWEYVFPRCLIRTRILRRTGRNQEALEELKRARTRWLDEGQVFNPYLYFLLVEFAAVWGNVEQPDNALKDAARAVATCQREVDDADAEGQKHTLALLHALTTFSNCLAAVGRNDEALAFVEDAVAIYTQNAEHMWEGLAFLLTIRKEELGANLFHSLSLRLATFGRQEEALVNANKATDLYRELVALAPGHLPILASSLRNLASILSNIGHRDEALDACNEAVRIMRNLVDPEPYFFPTLAEILDQLASYLKQKGDDGAAAAAAAGAEEARGRFADLPPQPEFLFKRVERVEIRREDQDVVQESEADEGWETTSEGDESEYHDALDTPTDVQEMFPEIEPEHSIVAESLPALKSRAAVSEELTPTNTTIPAKGHLKDILSTPLEVRLSIRSTPMDVLWWLLTGILFAVVWSRLV